MFEVKIIGIIVCALLFVYGIVRCIFDFKTMHDSFKDENSTKEIN